MLLAVDGALIGRLWPPERVVAGLRTNKWLREQISNGIQLVQLKTSRRLVDEGVHVNARDIARDLMRFSQDAWARVKISAASCAFLDDLLHGIRKTQLMGWNGSITWLELGNNSMGQQSRGKWLPECLQGCNGLLRLSLRQNGISDGSMTYFAPPLSTRTDLVFLDLSQNNLEDEGAKLLASAVVKMAQLAHLDVSSNDIGDDGVTSLFEALRLCTSLTDLSLSFNCFDIGAAGFLENTSLITLDLSGNGCDADGVRKLAPALQGSTSLKHLNLGMCELESTGAEELAALLRGKTSLERLELFANHLADRGVQALQPVLNASAKLTYLDLSDNDIEHRGAAALAAALERCFELRELNLGNNRLGRLGAAHLAAALPAFSALRALLLHENFIPDAAGSALLAAVAACPLRHIDMGANLLQDRAAASLAALLRRPSSALRWASLSANQISREGALEVAAAAAGAAWLESLSLENNELDADAKQRVRRTCVRVWVGSPERDKA